jgi:NAD(P)-dependent dehydrogenase (short-subunit alcohol dehydrogenase family)
VATAISTGSARENIRVLCILPGSVKTRNFNRMNSRAWPVCYHPIHRIQIERGAGMKFVITSNRYQKFGLPLSPRH